MAATTPPPSSHSSAKSHSVSQRSTLSIDDLKTCLHPQNSYFGPGIRFDAVSYMELASTESQLSIC